MLRLILVIVAALFIHAPAFAQSLPHWKSVLDSVKAGSGQARVVLLGDSIGLGWWGQGGGPINQVRNNAAFTHLVKFFRYAQPQAINASWGNVFGVGQPSPYGGPLPPTAIGAFDSRISGTGAVTGVGAVSLGGSGYWMSGAGTLTFTHGQPSNTVEIVSINGIAGSATVDAGGAPLATIVNTAGAYSLKKTTVNLPAGTTTINIKWASGYFQPLWWDMWDNSTPTVRLLNASFAYAKSVDFAANVNAYDPLPALQFLAPDLTVIMLGPNDFAAVTPIPTFTAAIQAIIDTAKLSGDVVIATFWPGNPAIVAQSLQDQYLNALKSLATTNSVHLVDANAVCGPYALMNSLGNVWNATHPSSGGEICMAFPLYEAIGNPH